MEERIKNGTREWKRELKRGLTTKWNERIEPYRFGGRVDPK